MPLHDWTRVSPNDYHTLHVFWVTSLSVALNNGVLPPVYYAMAEHVAPPFTPDVLTLGLGDGDLDDDDLDDDFRLTPWDEPGNGGGGGGTAVATETQVEATVKARLRRKIGPPERRIAVRHVEGRRLVAVIELVSPGNKAKSKEIIALAGKSAALIEAGVHVTIIDPFPNPKSMPQGFGGRVLKALGPKTIDYTPKFSRTHAAFAVQKDRSTVAKLTSSEVWRAIARAAAVPDRDPRRQAAAGGDVPDRLGRLPEAAQGGTRSDNIRAAGVSPPSFPRPASHAAGWERNSAG